MTKHYEVNVTSNDGYADIPSKAKFDIELHLAKNIIELSELVAAHGLQHVERFCYEATYLDHNDETVRTDCDCLHVTSDEFCFTAFLNDTSVEIRADFQSIDELKKHFAEELANEPESLEKRKAAFIEQVAALPIWDYDKPDGTPYKEAPPARDGFLDSHCDLMALIEEARQLK